MSTTFTKMHGSGNDFVVFDGINQSIHLSQPQLQKLADRHFGVGCDQVLIVEHSELADVDFRYRIFNADGGEVEQCGNGARCFARFVKDKGLTDKLKIAVETLSGVIYPEIQADGQVRVNMGEPQFEPEEIPFMAETRSQTYPLQVGGAEISVAVVSMGNPHVVQQVDNIDLAPVSTQGPMIERHPRFPNRVNAGYMQIVDSANIRLRVYERGAGETLACGTGACAAVVTARQHHQLDDKVAVSLPGGVLQIEWVGEGQPVWLTGPVATVFEGTIKLDTL